MVSTSNVYSTNYLTEQYINSDAYFIFFHELNVNVEVEKLWILCSLSWALFCFSIFGACYRKKNILVFMICIEVLLLSSVLNLINFSLLRLDPLGQIFALLVIALAASESAIGLGLLILSYRVKGDIAIEKHNFLH